MVRQPIGTLLLCCFHVDVSVTLIAACTWWTDVGNRKCQGDGRGDRETREAPLRLIWGGRCHGSAFRTATAVLDPRASTYLHGATGGVFVDELPVVRYKGPTGHAYRLHYTSAAGDVV